MEEEEAAVVAVVPRVSPSWFTVDDGVAEESEMPLRPPLLLIGADAEDDQDLRVEELEHLLGDGRRTLSLLESNRGRLQGQIAAVSTRGRRSRGTHRCHHGRAPAPATVAIIAPPPPPAVAPGGSEAPAAPYTGRKGGAGALRKRLKAAAGDVKKERERLEEVVRKLEEALVDARERLALQQMLAA